MPAHPVIHFRSSLDKNRRPADQLRPAGQIRQATPRYLPRAQGIDFAQRQNRRHDRHLGPAARAEKKLSALADRRGSEQRQPRHHRRQSACKRHPHLGQAAAAARFAHHHRRRHYVVIFTPYNRFSIPLLLRIKWLGARYLTGFAIPKYGTSTANLGMFDHTVPCDRSRHILHSFFAAFKAFGLRDIDLRYELFGVDSHAAQVDPACDTLLRTYEGLFCLNFQGSNAQRTVSVADAQRCCAALAARYPRHALLLIAAPGTEARAAEIVDGAGHANVMAAPPTGHILALAALIRRCELVLSPDTSVIHIASAYDKKIVGYYIHTDNYRWFYPASRHYRVILA